MKSRSLQKNIYKSRSFLLNEGKYDAVKKELTNALPKMAEESPTRVFNYFINNNKKIPEQFYKFITLEDDTGYGSGLSIYDIFKLHYHFIKKNQEIPLELSNILENIKNKNVTYHKVYRDVFENPYKAWVDYLYTVNIIEYRMVYLPRYVYTLHSKNEPIDPFVQYWLDNTNNGNYTKKQIFDNKENPLDSLKEYMPDYAELYLKESTNILEEGKYDAVKDELLNTLPKVAEENPVSVFRYFADNKKDIPEFVYDAFLNKKQMQVGYLLSRLIPTYDLKPQEQFYKYIPNPEIFNEDSIVNLHLYLIKKNKDIPSELHNRIKEMYDESEGEADKYQPHHFWARRLYALKDLNEYRIVYLPRYIYNLHSKGKKIDPFLQYWLTTPSGELVKQKIFDDKENPLDNLKDYYPDYAELYLKESTNILEEGKYDAVKDELLNTLASSKPKTLLKYAITKLRREKQIPDDIWKLISNNSESSADLGSHYIGKTKKSPPEIIINAAAKNANDAYVLARHYINYHKEVPKILIDTIISNPYLSFKLAEEMLGAETLDIIYMGSIDREILPDDILKTIMMDEKFAKEFLKAFVIILYDSRFSPSERKAFKLKYYNRIKPYISSNPTLNKDFVTNYFLQESTKILEKGKYDDVKQELIQNISNSTNSNSLRSAVQKIFKTYYDKDELDSNTFKSMFKVPYNRAFVDTINTMIKSKLIDGGLENKKSFIPFLLNTASLLKGDTTIIMSFLKDYKNESDVYWLNDDVMDKILTTLIEQQPSSFITIMWEQLEKISIDQLLEKYKKYIELFEKRVQPNQTSTISEYMRLLYSYGKMPSDYIFEKFKSTTGNKETMVDYAYRLLNQIMRQQSIQKLDDRLAEIVSTNYRYSKDFSNDFYYEKTKSTSMHRSWKYEFPDSIERKLMEGDMANPFSTTRKNDIYESVNVLEEGKYDAVRDELTKQVANNLNAPKLYDIMFYFFQREKLNSISLKKIILNYSNSFGERGATHVLTTFVRNEVDRVIRDVFIGWGEFNSFVDFVFETPSLLKNNFGVVYEFIKEVYLNDKIMDVIKKKYPDSIVRFEQEKQKRIKEEREKQEKQESAYGEYRKSVLKSYGIEESVNILKEGNHHNLKKELYDNMLSDPKIASRYGERLIKNKKEIPDDILNTISNDEDLSASIGSGYIDSLQKHPPEIIIQGAARKPSSSWGLASTFLGNDLEIPKILIDMIARNSYYSWRFAKEIFDVGRLPDEKLISFKEIPDNIFKKVMEDDVYRRRFIEHLKLEAERLERISWLTPDEKYIVKKTYFERVKPYIELIDFPFFKELITPLPPPPPRKSTNVQESTNILQEGKYDAIREELRKAFLSKNTGLKGSLYYKIDDYASQGDQGKIPDALVDLISQSPRMSTETIHIILRWNSNYKEKEKVEDLIPKSILYGAIKNPSHNAGFSKDRFEYVIGLIKALRFEIPEIYKRLVSVEVPVRNESTNILEEGKYDAVKGELVDAISSNTNTASNAAFKLINANKPVPEKIFKTVIEDVFSANNLAVKLIAYDKQVPDELIDVISTYSGFSRDLAMTMVSRNRFNDIPEKILNGITKPEDAEEFASKLFKYGYTIPNHILELILNSTEERHVKDFLNTMGGNRDKTEVAMELWNYSWKRILENKELKILNIILEVIRNGDAFQIPDFVFESERVSKDGKIGYADIDTIAEKILQMLEQQISRIGYNDTGQIIPIPDSLLQIILNYPKSSYRLARSMLVYRTGQIPDFLFSTFIKDESYCFEFLTTLVKIQNDRSTKSYPIIDIPKELVQNAIKYIQGEGAKYFTKEGEIKKYLDAFNKFLPSLNESTNILEEGKYDAVKQELAKSLEKLNGDEEDFDNYTEKMRDIRERMVHKMMTTQKVPEWYHFHVEKSKPFQYLADLVNRMLSGNKLLIDLHERKMVELAYEYGIDIDAVVYYIQFLIIHNKPLDNILKMVHEYGDKKDIEQHGGKAWNTYGMVMEILKNINNIHIIPIKILDIISKNAFYARSIIQDVLRNYDKLEKEFNIPTFMFKNIAKDRSENMEFIKFIILHTSFNVPDINAKALSEEDKEFIEKRWQGNMGRMYEF